VPGSTPGGPPEEWTEKVGDGVEERFEVAEFDLDERPSRLAVSEKLVGLVARSLAHPVLIPSKREGARHEGTPEAVRSERAFQRALAREIRPVELCIGKVRTKAVGEVIQLESAAVLFDEHQRVGVSISEVTPCAQGVRNAWRKLLPSRMVRLVLVEREGFVVEVEVLELERRSFAASHAFTVQEAVEEAIADPNLRGGEERCVLCRVEDRKPLLRTRLREPSAGEGIALDIPGELGEVQDQRQFARDLSRAVVAPA
jgi:hypothetical protein